MNNFDKELTELIKRSELFETLEPLGELGKIGKQFADVRNHFIANSNPEPIVSVMALSACVHMLQRLAIFPESAAKDAIENDLRRFCELLKKEEN